MVHGFFLTALLVLLFLPQSLCLSPDESSINLYYHGGKIMTKPVTVYLLWVGTGWKESGREAIRNALTSLTSSRYHNVKDSGVPTLGNWWEIIRQYRDGDNVPVTDRVDLGAECFYTGTELNMTQDQVFDIAKSAFNWNSSEGSGGKFLSCTRPFEMNKYGIYHVVFSYTAMFFDSPEQWKFMDCSGKFAIEASAGMMVNVVWQREPQNAADICSMLFNGKSYLGPPNGNEKIDSLVGYVLGNTAVEVTNGDGRGWSRNDGTGMTVSNSCASLMWREMDGPPLFKDTTRNVSFNVVGLNGYRYMVPYVWDQKISNCALKYSETCGAKAVILKQPKGYLSTGITVNHTNGLQPYAPNQKCVWKIECPKAKFISFSINYLSIAADSNDQILICESKSDRAKCSVIPSNARRFKLFSSKSYIEFRTDNQVSLESRGWEISFSAGLCNGRKDLYDRDGSISYTTSTSISYVEGLSCQWVLNGKPGTPVSVSFTYINISKNLDFVAIYDGKMQLITNFTGFYSVSDLPRMNLSGVVTIAFSTQTDKGEGWSANFNISSPVNHNKKLWPVIIVAVLGFVAVIVPLAFVILALNKKGKLISRRDSDEGLMLITIDTIREENRIGEGPSATVYRAVSNDGYIAIKCLRNRAAHTELEQEILLKCSSHPNIISLVGHAEDGLRRHLLLFEFMGRGDLAWNLKERGQNLNWDRRLAIALQVCSAIQMLHMYVKPPVYHGNIISENVLLDEFCNAKLGGFGVAKYCSSRENQGQPSEMAEDIWCFGLLLVELLTGEPQVNKQAYKDSRSFEEINELVGNGVILDRRLEIPNERCKTMALTKLGEIANWCIDSSLRVEGDKNNPKIGDVLSGLTQVKHLFCSISR
ncbi:hypothetical protein FEM48_Zijuj02G0048800 [Ziziphus jujuba var. spinosa]|uniref:Uncharacterized protein n=1 Tax=Ziziphus jujuba var. spinosa TaxID=714518 RepID=A0A978VTR2_ZIZJJ|nr:hypothetical protein FEM48_Zijuj02G0048800 [Ziziphus jujuba var. spinosa]